MLGNARSTRTASSGGFTLIELLVVIAIIGILASVVLASLNSARDRSKDTSIKSQMAEMRKQAELYFTENGTYGSNSISDTAGECRNMTNTFFGSASPGAITMLSSVITQSSGAPAGGRIYCAVSDTTKSWAFATGLQMPSGSNTGWCVDSSGSAKEVSISFSTAGSPLGGGGNLAVCP